MAGDPSIRGLTGALETGLAGVKRGQVKLDNTERPFNLISQTVEDILNKGTATFSWRELVSDKPLTDADRRAFIEFKPKLDYSELEPGKDATDAIRKAATDLNFAGQYSARVRLTGPVPIANEEYSTVQDGAILNGVVTVLIVLVILWMALHSGEDHLRGVREPVHRPFADDRGRPDDGGIAEPAVDRLCRAVRRPRRRFRHPVQRPLPFRAFQERRSGAGAGERGQTFGGAAVARRDGDRRRLPVFPADRLQGHFRTRQDRRRRHDDRVHHQHHGAACHAEAASPARRKRAGRLRVSGAGGRIPRKASRHHRRGYAASRRGRPAAALFHEVRLQPDQPAQSEGRIDRDLPRSAQGPQHRRQRHQRADHFGSGSEEDRGEAGKAAGSPARDVDRQFRARGSAGKAAVDREGGEGGGARAQSRFGRCGAHR